MNFQYIELEELIVRGVYKLRARNLTHGVWTGSLWIGIRDKFGLHLDECEVPYSTAYPTEFIEVLPEDIELKSRLPTECEVCARPVSFDEVESWTHNDEDFSQHKVRPISRQYERMFNYLLELQKNHD